ncbi:MAG: hypothetical protein AB7F31_06035 [Parachlamydiales bacterium]
MTRFAELRERLYKADNLPWTPFDALCRAKVEREVSRRVTEMVANGDYWQENRWSVSQRKALIQTPPCFYFIPGAYASYVPLALTKILTYAGLASFIGFGGWIGLSYLSHPLIPKMPPLLAHKRWAWLWGLGETTFLLWRVNIWGGTAQAVTTLATEGAFTLKSMGEKLEEQSHPWTFQDGEGVTKLITERVACWVREKDDPDYPGILARDDLAVLLPYDEVPSQPLLHLSTAFATLATATWLGTGLLALWRLANALPVPLHKSAAVGAALTGTALLSLGLHLHLASVHLSAKVREKG